jgi:SAM-dependent methyltransferase
VSDRDLYAGEVAQHILRLREALVRHDENLKAWTLLSECVPYFLLDHPAIAHARGDQHAMVRHILEPAAYRSYYGANPHELPFEQMYGIEPEHAHKHLYRVKFLREGLATADTEDRAPDRILDLAANDGWLAANLSKPGYVTDSLDLNPDCVARARERKQRWEGMGAVAQGDLLDAPSIYKPGYDAVVAFEVIEHVADPERMLAVMVEMAAPSGRLYVSTPLEAVEQGNLPDWHRVEPKGHVRVFRSKDFTALLDRFGAIERFEIGPDRVMCAEVAP